MNKHHDSDFTRSITPIFFEHYPNQWWWCFESDYPHTMDAHFQSPSLTFRAWGPFKIEALSRKGYWAYLYGKQDAI